MSIVINAKHFSPIVRVQTLVFFILISLVTSRPAIVIPYGLCHRLKSHHALYRSAQQDNTRCPRAFVACHNENGKVRRKTRRVLIKISIFFFSRIRYKSYILRDRSCSVLFQSAIFKNKYSPWNNIQYNI